MKKLYFLLLILIPLLAFGATIQWFHQQPATTTLADTDIFALETTPAAYRYITVANLKTQIGVGSSNQPIQYFVTYGSNYYGGDTLISNYFATNIFQDLRSLNYFSNYYFSTNITQTNVTLQQYISQDTIVSNYIWTNIFLVTAYSNYFTTNVFPTTNLFYTNNIGGDYIANLDGVGTNTTLRGTTWFWGPWYFMDGNGSPIAGYNSYYFWGDGSGLYNLNLTNLALLYVHTNIVYDHTTTNLTVRSNAYVHGDLYVNNISITNAFRRYMTTWLGPTNSLSIDTTFWIYTAPSDCAITNFTGGKAGFATDSALIVTNAATTNITFRITASGNFLDYVKTYTVTNGDVLHLAIERQGTAGADIVGRTGHPL